MAFSPALYTASVTPSRPAAHKYWFTALWRRLAAVLRSTRPWQSGWRSRISHTSSAAKLDFPLPRPPVST